LNPLITERWSHWHVIGAIILGALGIYVTRAAWGDIFEFASKNEEHSHIFIVPLVAAWLVWVRSARFRYTRPGGMVVGPVIVLVGWVVSSYGFYNGIQSMWHGGAVLIVLGCIISVVGKNVLFRFFPAVAVLIFLVPVPGRIRQHIAQPLQNSLAKVTQQSLELIGIATDRSGNLLSINGQPVAIAEACNGMRMVFALILVTYAFAFGLPLRNSVRFLLILASPVAAILANTVRMLPTVYLYGYTSKELGDLFHEYSGWIMLPVAFLMLYGIIRTLRWAMIPVTRYTLAS
jgi:exosortase